MALTLRLNNEEEKALAGLMKTYNVGTASGTIKRILTTLPPMLKDYKDAMYDILKITGELEELKSLIKERQDTKQRVNQLQSKLSKLANK